jgi:transposase
MYIKDEFKGRSRRRYSAQFKQELVILCRQPGMSVASVARHHGINHNIVHRWIREHLPPALTARPSPCASVAAEPGFIPVALPAQLQRDVGGVIEVNITRGDLQVHIRWPSSAATDAASCLQGLLR